MVLTLSAAFTREVAKSGIEPVYLIDIEVGPIAYITVNDFSLGAGATITITRNGGATLVRTEGVNFSAVTSNAVTATNIAAAFDNQTVGGPTIRSWARGSLVVFFAYQSVATTITVTSSHATAWLITPAPLERTVYLCTGSRMIGNYIPCVSDITGFSAELDVLTRAHSVGDISIEISDEGANGVFRNIARRTRLRGRTVTVRIGTADLAESDFVVAGTYLIDDVTPDLGVINVQCSEPVSWLRDTYATGNFFCMHPLAIILNLFEQTGSSTIVYDGASFNETNAAYAAVSHWAVSRSNFFTSDLTSDARPSNGLFEDGSSENKPSTLSIVNELLELMQGSILTRENGLTAFRLYDSTAAVARALTDDDIESFEQISTYENLINQVNVNCFYTSTIPTDLRYTLLYQTGDPISQFQYAASGASHEFSGVVDTDWLGNYAQLIVSMGTTGTTMRVIYPQFAGISGTRMSIGAPAGVTQRATDTLNGTTRVAWLLIVNSASFEIVQATVFTPETTDPLGNASAVLDVDPTPNNNAVTSSPAVDAVYRNGTFTVVRAQRGTTAVAWIDSAAGIPLLFGSSPPPRVYDITLAVNMAEARVNRFSNGCPVAKIRTSMVHYDLQVGDFVTITNDMYLNFQKDGADSNVVWEITSKEVDVFDDSPGINFTLAWVRDDVSYVATLANPTYTVQTTPPNSNNDVVTDNDGIWVYDEDNDVVRASS